MVLSSTLKELSDNIPDDDEDAESLLQDEIYGLVKQHGKKGSLLIIMYGGRGDDTSIWAA